MRRLSVLGVALALGLAATTTARADGARKTVLPSPQRKLVTPDRSHATNLRRPGMLEVGPRSGLGGGPCVDANPAR